MQMWAYAGSPSPPTRAGATGNKGMNTIHDLLLSPSPRRPGLKWLIGTPCSASETRSECGHGVLWPSRAIERRPIALQRAPEKELKTQGCCKGRAASPLPLRHTGDRAAKHIAAHRGASARLQLVRHALDTASVRLQRARLERTRVGPAAPRCLLARCLLARSCASGHELPPVTCSHGSRGCDATEGGAQQSE